MNKLFESVNDLFESNLLEEYSSDYNTLAEIRKEYLSYNGHGDITVETYNKDKKWYGVASFDIKDEGKLYVYEGHGNGSDDTEVSVDDFLKIYDFALVKEVWNGESYDREVLYQSSDWSNDKEYDKPGYGDEDVTIEDDTSNYR